MLKESLGKSLLVKDRGKIVENFGYNPIFAYYLSFEQIRKTKRAILLE
jgi:hypothetical protein